MDLAIAAREFLRVMAADRIAGTWQIRDRDPPDLADLAIERSPGVILSFQILHSKSKKALLRACRAMGSISSPESDPERSPGFELTSS